MEGIGGWGKEGSPVRWAHSRGTPGSWLEGSSWLPGLGRSAPKKSRQSPQIPDSDDGVLDFFLKISSTVYPSSRGRRQRELMFMKPICALGTGFNTQQASLHFKSLHGFSSLYQGSGNSRAANPGVPLNSKPCSLILNPGDSMHPSLPDLPPETPCPALWCGLGWRPLAWPLSADHF